LDIKGFPEVITLRGHHLLCIQGFQGYGYSPEFIHHLSQIIQFLENNPYQRIKIIDECDDICLKCPFMEGNSCITPSGNDKHIKVMDTAVIDHLDLNCGHDYIYDHLQEQVLHENNFNELKKICKTCTWQEECKFYNK
jgi:uncharacterized protein